jgi:hypothetical protein
MRRAWQWLTGADQRSGLLLDDVWQASARYERWTYIGLAALVIEGVLAVVLLL